MKNILNSVGVVIFAIANIFISYFYIRDLVGYFNGQYFEGMRYFIPLIIVNILFLFALIIMYFERGFSKQLLPFLMLVVMHNMTVGAGVVGMLFGGLIIVIISLIYSIWIIKKKRK